MWGTPSWMWSWELRVGLESAALSLHKLTISGNKCLRLFMANHWVQQLAHRQCGVNLHAALLFLFLLFLFFFLVVGSARVRMSPCLIWRIRRFAVFLCLTNSIKHFNISLYQSRCYHWVLRQSDTEILTWFNLWIPTDNRTRLRHAIFLQYQALLCPTIRIVLLINAISKTFPSGNRKLRRKLFIEML